MAELAVEFLCVCHERLSLIFFMAEKLVHHVDANLNEIFPSSTEYFTISSAFCTHLYNNHQAVTALSLSVLHRVKYSA